MRRTPVWVPVCMPALALVWLLAVAPAAAADREVIGLYIGIGAYTDSQVADVTVHETNRDVLLPMLAESFGIEWLEPVMDERATREGIAAGFRTLLDRAAGAAADGREVTLVVMYTGHGSQVRDQDGDEADGVDETWVTVHSSLDAGTADVRDDDIAAFRFAAERLGAEVVMIVESCHSETTFRGDDTRTLSVARERPPRGPREPLLPGLETPERTDGGGVAAGMVFDGIDGVASERFVMLAAARDAELAYIMTDADGRDWGRFSIALAESLSLLPAGATYRDLHAAVARRFSARFPQTIQHPTLHPATARLGLADELAFGGELPVPHARAAIDQNNDTMLRLDRGEVAGFGVGATVGLFESYDALARGGPPAAEAVVSEAGPFSSHATVPASLAHAARSGGAVATLLVPAAPAVDPLAVHLAPGLGEGVLAALRAEPPEGVRFLDDERSAAFVCEPVEGGGFVLARTGGLAPQREQTPTNAILRRADPTQDQQVLAEIIRSELDAYVRGQRLWAMVGREDQIDVWFETAEGERIPGSPLSDADLPERSTVSLMIDARGESLRYLSLAFAENGAPFKFGDQRAAQHPGTPLKFVIQTPAAAEGDRTTTVRLKIVATESRIDLNTLLKPEGARATERRATRGAGETGGLMDRLFDDAMSGRRGGSAAGGRSFVATNRVLRIVPRAEQGEPTGDG
ncbi:MAG: caspase family protein [Planctomycetota bacterium]